MKIISACLCGIDCKYNGGNNYEARFKKLAENEPCLLVCPETIGGLPVPRYPCEILGGTGKDVIAGYAKVIDKNGHDLTDNFLEGAYQTLILAKSKGASCAILKSRSPSCGSGKIYNGTFKSELTKGDGVTAALLRMHGIKVLSNEDYLKE
jgi:uncharacterized protein YbbK (DUF523 family)